MRSLGQSHRGRRGFDTSEWPLMKEELSRLLQESCHNHNPEDRCAQCRVLVSTTGVRLLKPCRILFEHPAKLYRTTEQAERSSLLSNRTTSKSRMDKFSSLLMNEMRCGYLSTQSRAPAEVRPGDEATVESTTEDRLACQRIARQRVVGTFSRTELHLDSGSPGKWSPQLSTVTRTGYVHTCMKVSVSLRFASSSLIEV